MSVIHSNQPAVLKRARFCKMACSIAVIAFSVASCSAVEGTLFGETAALKAPNQVSQRVTAPKKSYGYQRTSANLVVASVEADKAPVAVARVDDLGSSPYTCSPSGFGQKARCYLR